MYDREWEAQFCRIAEKHPKIRAYVKNHNLGFEVPYSYEGLQRAYLPDFILKVEDGHGEDDLLNLIVEIKGQRDENDKAKKEAIETYWIPGINRLKTYGRWAFVEIVNVYEIESELDAIIESTKGGTRQRTDLFNHRGTGL